MTADDSTDTITFTVNDGYDADSVTVFINGEQQEITGTSFAKPANGAVVISATKVRAAAEHAWWESPRLVATTELEKTWGDNTYGPWHMAMSADYLAAPGWLDGVELFTIDDVLAGGKTPFAKVAKNERCNFYGAGVCQELNVVLCGTETGTAAMSIPLDSEPELGENMFYIENDQGLGLNQFFFSEDRKYVYAICYAKKVDADRNYIYKFNILNGLKSDGVNLTLEAKYDFGQRVRSFCLTKIGQKEMFYAILDDKSIGVMDPEVGTANTLLSDTDLVHAGKYGSVWVSSGKYLTIGESNGANQTGIEVFELADDGLTTVSKKISLNADACAAIGLPKANSFAISALTSEDNGTLYAGWMSRKLYTIQYCPKYEVIFDAGETATTNFVWEGDTTTAPADPVKAGYNFLGWFDGDGNEFDPAVPVMADATYTAKFELITYDITIAPVENGTLETSVTNNVTPGATVEVIATPASGFKVKAITVDGVAITGTTFEMPAENVTVAAEFEQASVDPETPILPPTDKTAEEYAEDLNKNGGAGAAALVKAPAVVTDAGDIAAYKACFKAAVDGDYVKLVLDEEKAKTTIVPELNEAEADIVDNFDGGEISVDVIPGLYYGIAAQAEVGAIKGADAVQWVQATTENKNSFTLTVPEVKVDNVKSSKAFFQVKCTDVPATK